MHYYINPWYFYLIDICESIKIVSIIYFIITTVITIIFGSIFLAEKTSYYDNDDWKKFYNTYGKMLKKFITSIIFAIVLMIFIPSEQTCTRMLISSFITEENVETAQETIKNTVDYVMDRIEGKEAED